MAETRVVITGDANQAVSEFQRLLAAATGSLQNIAALGGSTTKVLAGIAGTVAAAGAAYLSFGGIINGVSDSIDRLAQLDDAAQKTGSSIVDSLSKLQKVAMMTNVEFANVDKAVFNLAKTLGSGGEEADKARKALADLGISAKDIEGEDTAATFIRIAKALQNYEDGAGKSATMNTLFKKSAEELVPFMNDVAESVDKFSGRTSQAAAQASGFQDAIGLMHVRTAEMYDVLADNLLPALGAFTGRLLDSDGAISQVSLSIDPQGKSAEQSKWAENIATSVGYVVNAVVPAVKVTAAYFALFVAAPVIYTAVATAVSTLVGVIATYAMNVLIGQAATVGLNTSLFGTSVAAQLAAGSLTKVALVGNVLFAAFAGWEIGKYLRDNFVEARLAGLTFVGVMLTGWENLKYGVSVAVEAIGFAWDKTVGTMKIAYAGFVSGVAKGLSFIGQGDRAAQMEEYADSLRAAGGAAGTFAARTAALDAAHKAELDTIDKNIVEMMAYEMASKAATAADGAAENGKKKFLKASKDNSATVKAEQDAYTGLITSIRAATEENRQQLAAGVAATASEKTSIKITQELASGKLKLSEAHLATVNAALAEQAATEQLLKTQQAAKLVSDTMADSAQNRNASNATLAAEYALYGQTSDARDIAMVAVKAETDLEKFLSDQRRAGVAISEEMVAGLEAERDMRVSVEQATMAQSKALAYAASLKIENTKFAAESIADPRARADALLAIDADVWSQRIAMAGAGTEAQRLLQDEYNTWYKNQSNKLLVEVDLTRATELLTIMKAVDDAARQAAAGMTESFGRFGSAIGGLTTALTGYAVEQQAIAAQLAAVKADPKSGTDKIAKAEIAASKASAQAQIKSYGDMAGAAKGFFKENTAGYKLLQTTEKAFRAFEMAMAVESMVKRLFAAEAVTTAVVAGKAVESVAMIGAATVDTATTGVSVANSAAKTTASTVAGVAKAFEQMGVYGFIGAAAIIAFMASMGSGAKGGTGGFDVAKDRQEKAGTGSVLGAESAKSESIGRAIENLEKYASVELSHTRDMLSALVKIRDTIGVVAAMASQTAGLRATSLDEKKYGVGSSSGVLGIGASSTTIQDSGIKLNGKQTIGSAIESGVDATGYVDILKKKSGLFGIGSSSKTSRDVIQLDEDLKNQFGLLVGSMRDGAIEAVKVLGVSTDGIVDKINGTALGIDEISFKGLTGAEIEEQLQAVFSKVGDDIAKLAVPELAQFQKVGEGYLETLTRVATDYATVDSIMESSGRTFGAVGLASVDARERLIKMAGGLDNLVNSSQSFNENFLTEAEKLAPVQKYVTSELAAMGLQGIVTREQFKQVVLGLDVTTEAGAKQYTSMLALADAFAKTHAATVDLSRSEQDIADERTDLRNQLDDLTMTQAEKADKVRAAIAGVNLALFDQVIAAQAAQDAIAEGNTILDLQGQIYAVTGDKAGAAAVLEAQHQAALVGLTPAVAAVTKELWAAQAVEAARKDALAESNSLLAIQAQIYALTGDSAGATAVKTQQQAAALVGLSPALAQATKELQALQNRADTISLVKADATALTNAVSAALSSVQSMVDAEKKAVTTAHKAAMAALDEQIDTSTKAIAKFKSLSDALHSAVESIQAEAVSLDDRAGAQAEIATALAIARAGGALPSADALKSALGVLTKDASDQFTSYVDYQRDAYMTARDLNALASLTDAQLSTEEKALALMEEQKEFAEKAYDAEMLRLDGILDTAKASVDELKGINGGINSLPAVLAALAASIKAAQANPVVTAPSQIGAAYQTYLGRAPEAGAVDWWTNQAANGVDVVKGIANSNEAKIQDLYKNLLGRTGEAAGVDFWEAQLASGKSLDQIKDGFMASDEYKKAHPIPGFESGGDHSGGYRVVGENGAELEATGPSRIFNAAQTRSMLGGDNSALVAELRAQRDDQRRENAELREVLESHLYAIAKSNMNIEGFLEGAVNGEAPISTTEAEVTA